MREAVICLTIVCLCVSPASAGLAAGDYLISEYIEGSSFNKALELYNTTVSTLSDPVSIEIYFNGSTTPGQVIVASPVSLAPGDVWVIAHTSANASILAVADETSGNLNFNGDDAIRVLHIGSGALMDSIGQVGFDPGSEWSGSGVGTQDETLVRKNLTPDSDANDAYDPSVNFVSLGTDDFSDIGIGTILPVELSIFSAD